MRSTKSLNHTHAHLVTLNYFTSVTPRMTQQMSWWKNLQPTTCMIAIYILTVYFRSWYFLALYVRVLLWGTTYARGTDCDNFTLSGRTTWGADHLRRDSLQVRSGYISKESRDLEYCRNDTPDLLEGFKLNKLYIFRICKELIFSVKRRKCKGEPLIRDVRKLKILSVNCMVPSDSLLFRSLCLDKESQNLNNSYASFYSGNLSKGKLGIQILLIG